MVDIDMTREPESGLLLGVNLWEVRDCKVEKAKSSGENMAVIKLKCGDVELVDRAMLGGPGFKYGKQKLIGLGISPTFQGAFDPIALIGVRVWVATREEKYQGIDRKTGQARGYTSAKVDEQKLLFAGYQPEANVPAGATLPVEKWPTAVSDTPF